MVHAEFPEKNLQARITVTFYWAPLRPQQFIRATVEEGIAC